MEAMSPGYETEDTPLHRDVAEHIDELKKENFNLKLRIYHMEEHISSKGGQDWRSIISQKVEVLSLTMLARVLTIIFSCKKKRQNWRKTKIY